ncbi:flavin reductase family protein [Hoeflea sp. CAU 1731]
MIEHPELSQFRQAVSRFTTGVTVVTTVDAAGKRIGMTANSFTSVSLAPPTVLISIKTGRTLEAIRSTGKFAVNILPAFGKDLSIHFAGRPSSGPAPEFEPTGGMPKLLHAIAYFDCEATRFVTVADHTLLIGAVCACTHEDEAEPLVFFSSRYHALAN